METSATDHARLAQARKEEALAFFRRRWETLSDRKPRKLVWSHAGLGFGTESRLHFFHSLCNNARAHATMAHRLTVNNLRMIKLS
jgi:hypothetical protein